MAQQSATVLNFEAHRLHALKRAGSELIWFVLADVCEILELEKPRNVAARLKENQKGALTTGTPGGPQTMIIVSEDAVYRIACRSNKPIAERFADWLYREVLPEIRRTGGYEGGAAPLDALIGEMQLALPIGEPVRENVIELPIIDPVREEAELEAELQKYNAEFGYETALPKGLVAVDEKQRQRYLEAWRARNRGCNQLRDDSGPQLCYGPAGTLVEKYDV
jgi:prophage antirepressor-like protein